MLSKQSEKSAKEWLSADYDAKTRAEIQALFDVENWKELEDRFYRTLEFGTGGLRGVMAAGTNRMNVYTVAQATQGLANYILKKVTNPRHRKIAVSHDSRHNHKQFAETVASVMAANGITTHLVKKMRPTPLLSFAVRELGCCSGIMITASHNPKEYNGYKVYWDDGSQVVPPHDKGIINEVKKVKSLSQVKRIDYKAAVKKGKVKWIGAEIDKAYVDAVKKCSLNKGIIKKFGAETKIVYTPLHGVGGTLTPRALRSWGFKNIIEVEHQMKPDGDFPTAASPNPEEAVALAEAIKVAKKHNAELVMATDPDADRVGIAVRERKGKYKLISGNQLGAMIAYYYCEAHTNNGTMPPDPLIVGTIVTSDLYEHIAKAYDVDTEECLTGFKWIASVMRGYEQKRKAGKKYKNYIFGYEESYGYLIGEHVRDKDAVVASCTVAELACWARSKGLSLISLLEEINMKFGVFIEKQISIYHKGKTGMEKIQSIMTKLRENPLKKIGTQNVITFTDYQANTTTDVKSKKVGKGPGLPKSNVLEFALKDGSKVFVRPSGTEPKIKFYFNFCDTEKIPIGTKKELKARTAALQAKMDVAVVSLEKKTK